MEKIEIRKKCKKYAEKFVKVQKKQFKALGVSGDWESAYLTFTPQYEAGIIEVFGKLVEKGYVYRSLKPIHWCMCCETALAEAELEHQDKTSPSIYVNFKLINSPKNIFPENSGRRCSYVDMDYYSMDTARKPCNRGASGISIHSSKVHKS